jgi:hypothetical protein
MKNIQFNLTHWIHSLHILSITDPKCEAPSAPLSLLLFLNSLGTIILEMMDQTRESLHLLNHVI